LTDLATHSDARYSLTPHWFSWKHKDETSTRVSIFFKKSEAMLVKTIYIYETRQHGNKSHILSKFLQQNMTFLGETSSQMIVNSRLGFIFPNGSIIHNDSGVYFQTSTLVPIRVPNTCDLAMLKIRIHNTLQLTDK